jgi:Holliday junction resolvasome RuvABC DNA-binding subunit
VRAVRSDEPHGLARDGLLELGYSAAEADALLADAAGDTAEELLAAALRGARR